MTCLSEVGRLRQAVDLTEVSRRVQAIAPAPSEPVRSDVACALPDCLRANSLCRPLAASDERHRNLHKVEPQAERPDHHLISQERALAVQLKRLQRFRAMEGDVLKVVHFQTVEDAQDVIVRKGDHRTEKIIRPRPDAIDRADDRYEGEEPNSQRANADHDAEIIEEVEEDPEVGDVVGPVDGLP